MSQLVEPITGRLRRRSRNHDRVSVDGGDETKFLVENMDQVIESFRVRRIPDTSRSSLRARLGLLISRPLSGSKAPRTNCAASWWSRCLRFAYSSLKVISRKAAPTPSASPNFLKVLEFHS